MADHMNEVVKNVKEKEKKGEKELLDYLRGLTIDDLNRLLVIFNMNVGLSVRTVFQASITGAGIIGVIVGYPDMSEMKFIIFKVCLLLFLAMYSLFWLIRAFKMTSENGMIANSYKATSKQKILTLISFALQEKYKKL